MAMGMLVPSGAGCARLIASWPPRARSSVKPLATLRPSPTGEPVDWVAATSGFFEKDSRPIMLFDGTIHLRRGPQFSGMSFLVVVFVLVLLG